MSLDIRENFFVEDKPSEVRSAWKCDGCKRLIYKTKDSHPAPGAPIPKYINTDYKQVCTVCYEMHWALNNKSYWLNLPASSRGTILQPDMCLEKFR